MKKILIGYISYGENNGITRYLLDVGRMLQRQGHQVDFLTSSLEDKVKDILKRENFRLFETTTLKHPYLQYRKIHVLCQKEKYDIAYFNISEALNCIGILTAKTCGIGKIVVHTHSAGINKRQVWLRWFRYCFHLFAKYFIIPYCATDYYACSKNAGVWMFTKRLRNSDRFYIVQNAVDFSKFHYDASLRQRIRQEMKVEKKKVIAYIGGFTYAKNYLYMAQIAKELVKDPTIEFWCIGGGYANLVQEVCSVFAQSENFAQIRMLGVREDISVLMQAMDAVILPSFFEGMPYVAIEAQATGLAVFLSNRISSEAKVTDHTYFLSIDESPKVWANWIFQHISYERKTQHIAGFDLKEQQKYLQKILLERV